jgi:hypothetical protein
MSALDARRCLYSNDERECGSCDVCRAKARVTEAYAAGVAGERERCARVCEVMAVRTGNWCSTECIVCADAIRGKGLK